MGRSQIYDKQFYYDLGKSLGLTGADLDEADRHSRSWQAAAMRNGYRAGSALYTLGGKGYEHKDVPLHGRSKIFTKFCQVEHPNSKRSCGCAFGQCAKGLIL